MCIDRGHNVKEMRGKDWIVTVAQKLKNEGPRMNDRGQKVNKMNH